MKRSEKGTPPSGNYYVLSSFRKKETEGTPCQEETKLWVQK